MAAGAGAAAAGADQSTFVEVYIWRGRDDEGNVVNSGMGGLKFRRYPDSPARTGHVSMLISKEGKQHYVSFWPKNRGENGPAILRDTPADGDILAEDIAAEGTKPDVIFRLFHMQIDSMLHAFNALKERVEGRKKPSITWNVESSATELVTARTVDKTFCKAHCSSFVWALLEIGFDRDHKSKLTEDFEEDDFYRTLHLHRARIFGNALIEYELIASRCTPYMMSYRLAKAIRAFSDEKEATLKIMNSDRVTEIKEGETTFWDWGKNALVGIGVVSLLSAVLGKRS